MGLGPIPLTSIYEEASRLDLDEVETDRFLICIREMDAAFTNLTKPNTTNADGDVVHNVPLDEGIADRIFGI